MISASREEPHRSCPRRMCDKQEILQQNTCLLWKMDEQRSDHSCFEDLPTRICQPRWRKVTVHTRIPITTNSETLKVLVLLTREGAYMWPT